MFSRNVHQRQIGLRANPQRGATGGNDCIKPKSTERIAEEENIRTLEFSAGLLLRVKVHNSGSCDNAGIQPCEVNEFNGWAAGDIAGEIERFHDRVAGGARDGRDHGAAVAEKCIEKRAFAHIRRADEGDAGETCGTLGTGCGAKFRVQFGDEGVEFRGEQHGCDGNDVLLIGKVDAGFDEREQRGGAIRPGAVALAGAPAHERTRRGELVLGARRDQRGDTLGLRDGHAPVQIRPRGKLAGLGFADTRLCEQSRNDALQKKRIAR